VWHRAGGGCGWWWRRSGEGEGAGTGRAASVLGGEGDRMVGSGNVVVERRVHTRVVAHRSWGWGSELRSLGRGFCRHEREGWRLGGGATRGSKSKGAAASLSPARLAVVPAVEKCSRMEGP
jgi:hypothetical protein